MGYYSHSIGTRGYPYFKFAEQNDVLYWAIYAAANKPFAASFADIFIDADYSTATGYIGATYSPWTSSGLDYLLQGNMVYYFSNSNQNEWGWAPINYGVLRTAVPDSTILEYSSEKSWYIQFSLGTTLGIGLQLFPKAGERCDLPGPDNGFTNKKIYKVKNRTTLDITTTLGLTDTIKLNCTNAFYNPYMNDPDTDGFLNFQNGTDHTANPSHWASWAINLATPQIFDLRMTYQSTNAGQISLSFVDMATNAVAKTFPAIDFSTNGTMSETKVFQIDASDIPAGRYMVVLKNSATNSNLKVQNLKLTKGTGAVSKWDNVPIQSEPGVYPYFRLAEENNTLFLAFYAEQGKKFVPAQYCWVDVFFDSDRLKTTGYVGDYNHWPAAGLDYLIQGTSLLYHSGGSPTTWDWISAGSIVRTMNSDNTTTEYSVAKSNFNQNSLEATFGVSFQPYYEKLDDPGNIEAFNFPVIDAGFSADARNIFKIKNRTTLDITTALGSTDTIKLNCTNAFYNPYMNDPDTDGFLNFQNGIDYTANPRHWASWGINLTTPQIFDLRMTYTSTAAGQISLSFVDMKTNLVAKTFSAINYSTNVAMSEIQMSQIDVSDIPAGRYMVVLKNSETNSELKVQNLKLTKATSSHLDEVQLQKDVIISVHNKQLTITSKSDTKISFSVYTISGALISQMDNTSSVTLHLERGAYILSVNNGGNVFSKKIMVL